MIGFDDLDGLFQTKCFYDSMTCNTLLRTCLHPWDGPELLLTTSESLCLYCHLHVTTCACVTGVVMCSWAQPSATPPSLCRLPAGALARAGMKRNVRMNIASARHAVSTTSAKLHPRVGKQEWSHSQSKLITFSMQNHPKSLSPGILHLLLALCRAYLQDANRAETFPAYKPQKPLEITKICLGAST